MPGDQKLSPPRRGPAQAMQPQAAPTAWSCRPGQSCLSWPESSMVREQGTKQRAPGSPVPCTAAPESPCPRTADLFPQPQGLIICVAPGAPEQSSPVGGRPGVHPAWPATLKHMDLRNRCGLGPALISQSPVHCKLPTLAETSSAAGDAELGLPALGVPGPTKGSGVPEIPRRRPLLPGTLRALRPAWRWTVFPAGPPYPKGPHQVTQPGDPAGV